jgi:hypothetical protein
MGPTGRDSASRVRSSIASDDPEAVSARTDGDEEAAADRELDAVHSPLPEEFDRLFARPPATRAARASALRPRPPDR